MKNEEKPIVVFGGTGYLGRKIVKKLLDKNVKVRVLSRDSQKAKTILGEDVEIIEGDVTCRDTVIRSLEGVKAILICLAAHTFRLIKRMKQIEGDAVLMIMDEAHKANIDRLVYLSGYEIREDFLRKLNMINFGEIKLEIEEKIRESKFNWTILGCAVPFELFFGFLRNNKMAVPGGGIKPIPAISPEDVGEITAQTVLRSDLSGKRFRLTGPEAISFPEAAERISAITKKQIKHIKIPLIAVKIVSIITLPFNPFIRFIYRSLKLLNNFPSDLAKNVPEDHQILLETFTYTPITFDMQIRNRFVER
ncbi:MAG: SDR family oxidoreductase [Candidatus Zixiibacteriota bacterium]